MPKAQRFSVALKHGYMRLLTKKVAAILTTQTLINGSNHIEFATMTGYIFSSSPLHS
jgi:hypothetical protein